MPPPGAGLNTVTLAIPEVAISAAAMAACICVALTYVVVRLEPFHSTTDALTNPVPFTVRVNAAPPAVAEAGDTVLILGTLFAALMVKVELLDVPPPGVGLNTVTCPVPDFAISPARIAAFTCVALTYVVVRLEPFHCTTDPLMNPVPFTVRVNAAPPAVAEAGDSVLIVGTGFAALMVNAELPEVPPPGVGLETVTGAVPAAAMSAAEMAACNCVALTNVVVRAEPFQLTTELLMKPLPFTVRVKAAPPAVVLAGDREVTVGRGLGALMVNAELPEVPPPGAGLETVTGAVPAAAMSAAEMAACSCEALTNVVVRAEPFHLTTELLMNPLPFTVRVKAAPPAVALAGDREVTVGKGLGALMVNAELPEVPPPGAGLETVTGAVPAAAMSAAEMAACNCEALTNVVVLAEPFQLTTELLMNPLPFTVRVKAAPPAVALAGDREVTVGSGLGALMVNAELPEVPPPGAGLETVTGAVPAAAMSAAEMAACNCEALTNVVVRAEPFQLTTELLMNPLPFTVRVKAAPPAVALAGDREVTVGRGLGALMVNAELPEVPPPGAGLDTVTGAVPAAAMSAAEMAACNCEALTNVVVRAEPFQLTTELLMNPLPFTVRVKAAPPAVALAGDREVTVGRGLGALMVNAELLEVPPPGVGLETVTGAVPAAAMSAAEMAACSCEALTNVVVRAEPFHLTTELLMNPLPFTVRVKAAPPAVALAGDREVTVGKGLGALMVNAELPEVPPPGAGLETVTGAVPAAAISAAEMAACNCEALTNVVVLAEPFQLTTELLMNPLPFTVRVKAAPPAVALAGDREVMEGDGLVGTLMVPPVPVTGVTVPSTKAPSVFVTERGTDKLLVGVSVTVTTAAVPLPMVCEFMPLVRHVVDPVIALQASVLPEAVNAGPAATLREATFPGE